MRTVLNSSVDPLLGRLLDGRYEISGRLAQGGMAVVYTAFDTRLDRTVAVKVMHPALAADEEFVARFRREAKAAARLSSPHVVSVTDQGRDGDVVFLVMELIEGRTLRQVLHEHGRLRPAEALEVLIQVLEALAAAHRSGLVHRDIKPENVLVADDGAVKVTDFGLARAVDASPLTATAGLLLGTVAYLAPEQVARGMADARTDIYASGVMLFELLTGRVPFEGATALQVAYQHLNEDVPPPSTLQPDLPPALDRLVAAATARDPDDRPHDATALMFRTRAVLQRLSPDDEPHVSQRDTAPLSLDLAEAAALERIAREQQRASSLAVAGGDQVVDDPETGELTALPVANAGEASGFDAARQDPDEPAAGEANYGDTLSGDDADGPAPKARRRFVRPGRVVALLVVLATLAAALVGWRLAGRRVAVPSVIGQTPASAQTALRKAHLTPQLSGVQVYSETVPKGQVAALQPAAGHHVSRGSRVTVSLSLGPERYTVPTVTKLAVAEAVSALRVSHLQPGPQTQAYNDTVPAGAIISSDPRPGVLAKPDTAVALVVSRGPAPVTAPNLSALTPAAAQTALQKLGLRVKTSVDFSETVAIGGIIGITPPTGLHRTQTVTLHVSKGPQLVQIPPGIENDSPGYAKQLLRSLGLNVVTRSFPGLDGTILTVRPGGGSLVRLGSQVTIFLY